MLSLQLPNNKIPFSLYFQAMFPCGQQIVQKEGLETIPQKAARMLINLKRLTQRKLNSKT